MPTTASQTPTRVAMIREEDIRVLQGILEGKLTCCCPHCFANGQTITARLISAARSLLRASRAAGDPDLHLRHGLRAGKRRQCPSVTRAPAPADKVVVRYVVEQVLQRAAAILLRILDLLAQFSRRTPGKHHLVLR